MWSTVLPKDLVGNWEFLEPPPKIVSMLLLVFVSLDSLKQLAGDFLSFAKKGMNLLTQVLSLNTSLTKAASVDKLYPNVSLLT